MDEFNKFIDSRNSVFQSEIFVKFTAQVQEIINNDNSDNILESLGRFLGLVSSTTLANANQLSLKHLKAYHQWLQENYEMIPKKQ